VKETIKSIETQYKGYRFRSRLEARWAVFFDHLGISWGYEVEGLQSATLGFYLPDFTIYNVNRIHRLEIKPIEPDNETTDRILGFGASLLVGDPWRDGKDYPFMYNYYVLSRDYCEEYGALDTHEVFAACKCGCKNIYMQRLESAGEFKNNRGEVVDIVDYYDRFCQHCNNSGTDARFDDRCYETQISDRLTSAYRAARAASFEHKKYLL